MKKINSIMWYSFIIIVLIMLFITNNSKNIKEINKFNIKIEGRDKFLNSENIKEIIFNNNIELQKTKQYDIDIDKLESDIYNTSYIEKVKVYNNLDGIINIDIDIKQPIARFYHSANESFYIDKNGIKINLSKNFISRIMVVTCNDKKNINTLIKNSEFINLLNKINNNIFLKSLVEQIHVKKNKLIIIPKVSNATIYFGDIEEIDKKLNRIIKIYKELSPYNIENYSKIDLRYKNQIVCVKNL